MTVATVGMSALIIVDHYVISQNLLTAYSFCEDFMSVAIAFFIRKWSELSKLAGQFVYIHSSLSICYRFDNDIIMFYDLANGTFHVAAHFCFVDFFLDCRDHLG